MNKEIITHLNMLDELITNCLNPEDDETQEIQKTFKLLCDALNKEETERTNKEFIPLTDEEINKIANESDKFKK